MYAEDACMLGWKQAARKSCLAQECALTLEFSVRVLTALGPRFCVWFKNSRKLRLGFKMLNVLEIIGPSMGAHMS